MRLGICWPAFAFFALLLGAPVAHASVAVEVSDNGYEACVREQVTFGMFTKSGPASVVVPKPADALAAAMGECHRQYPQTSDAERKRVDERVSRDTFAAYPEK